MTNIVLTNAIKRNTANLNAPVFISKNGCFVYVVYRQTPSFQNAIIDPYLTQAVNPRYQELISLLIQEINGVFEIVRQGIINGPPIDIQQIQDIYDFALFTVQDSFDSYINVFFESLLELFPNLTSEALHEIFDESFTIPLQNVEQTLLNIINTQYPNLINISEQINSGSPFDLETLNELNIEYVAQYEQMRPAILEITQQMIGLTTSELFYNVCGKLVSAWSTNITDEEPLFRQMLGGSASPCFNRFFLADNTFVSTENNQLRLRLFDRKGNVIKTRILDDYGTIPQSRNSFKGGNFSSDGCLIQISYKTPDNNTIVRILDSYTLKDIITHKITNSIIAQPGKIISLNIKRICECNICMHKYYLILNEIPLTSEINAIFPIYDPISSDVQGPSVITIYELGCKNLKLIDGVRLPQVLYNVDFKIDCNDLLLLVGTFTANTITQNTIDYIQSFIPNDGNELRLYKFNGCQLTLLSAKNIDSAVYPIFGCCDEIIYSTWNNPTFSTFLFGTTQHFSSLVLQKNKNTKTLCDSEICDKEISLPKTSIAISADCQWIVQTGSADGESNYNNIILYKLY